MTAGTERLTSNSQSYNVLRGGSGAHCKITSMKLGIIRLTMIAVLAASIPASFGAAADRKEGQATLLEENEYPCSNCFFGTSDYYFCFSVDSKIVIAHDK